MYKIILASHGQLAKGMLSSIEMITGLQDNISAYGLENGNHPDAIAEDIGGLIEMDTERVYDYIIITDIIGGSVHTSLARLCKHENVHLISGMNLGLILEIALAPKDMKLYDMIPDAMQKAKDSIVYYNSVIANESKVRGGELSIW